MSRAETDMPPPVHRSRLYAIALAAAILLLAACGQQSREPAREASAPLISDGLIGQRVDDFQLLDQHGRAHRLHYHKNASAIVLMTQGNGCPIVRNAMPALREVRDAYAKRGVEFWLLNSNLQDDRASIAAEAEAFAFDLPVLVDSNQLVGESLGVERTAEVFVIDPASWRVAYHGPVDDRLDYQTQRARAERHYLADALDAVLRQRQPEPATVEAPGCLIHFPERERRSQHAEISYSDSIAPLLEKHCVACHQRGGIGPWAMDSYDMVVGFAPMIREVIRTDRMPPWHADPDVGHFLRDRNLSPAETRTLVHWIEAGAPRGDGPDPLAQARPAPEPWPLGEPDLILDLPPFTVPATGVVDYQRPFVANPLKQAQWLRASTVKVGSRETVHHILGGHLAKIPASGHSDERHWGTTVAGYAVGAESTIAPDNAGAYIPGGGAFGFQMHYTPYGRSATDQTQLGLYFYEQAPTHIVRTIFILDTTIDIPPKTRRHDEVAYLRFPRAAQLYSAFPHAHYRGDASSLSIRYPDGREDELLSLPRYDFNWQREYEFAEPIEVPAGAWLIARYSYDNSAQNTANPDPSRRVRWGEQSDEEMLFTVLRYRWLDESSSDKRPEYERELRAGRLIGMLDDNLNGQLERSELKGRHGTRLADHFRRIDRNRDRILSPQELQTFAAANNKPG